MASSASWRRLVVCAATAGLAGKLSEHTLRAAGRWQGDAMSLYTRASKEAMMSIATIVGSTAFEDIERGEFVDEELMVTSKDLKAPGGVYDHLIGDDLVADAIEDDNESEEEDASYSMRSHSMSYELSHATDAPMALSGCERVEAAATGARTGARRFKVAMSMCDAPRPETAALPDGTSGCSDTLTHRLL